MQKDWKIFSLCYNSFMKFSLILLSSASLLYLSHFLLGNPTREYGDPVVSFFMGLGLIGIILSIACFCMNMGFRKLKEKKMPITWMFVSMICFLAFFSYEVLVLLERAKVVGIAW